MKPAASQISARKAVMLIIVATIIESLAEEHDDKAIVPVVEELGLVERYLREEMMGLMETKSERDMVLEELAQDALERLAL